MPKHLYYKLNITLRSPLNIGCGDDDFTDSDVITDGRGLPFIPATSLAGGLRSSFCESKADDYFGSVSGENSNQSKITVYDAVLDSLYKYARPLIRDGVRLNEYRVAQDGGKFDYEVIETGTCFTSYIEIADCTDEIEIDIIEALSAINRGDLLFGAKSSRGYGRFTLDVLQKRFDTETELDSWLDFDMYSPKAWTTATAVKLNEITDDTVIMLELRQIGGLSIREYSTDVAANDDSEPDYHTLALSDGRPVISGTSWAGAFLNNIKTAGCPDEIISKAFGYVDTTGKNNSNKQKSLIIFNESILSGGAYKTLTRNSIDRFSAGTKDGALYTERAYFGGSCTLEIRLKNGYPKEIDRYLEAALCDLDCGFMWIGGLGSVGRGLFEIISTNKNVVDITDSLKKHAVGGII